MEAERMTEYHEQTSASDRIEAARKVLTDYDEHDEPRSLHERRMREYRLASALRALITPPATSDSEEDVADRIVTAFPSPYTPSVGYSYGELVELAITAYRAGIQSAHESWESADVPSQEFMLRYLGLDYWDGYADDGSNAWKIPAQSIEKEDD
jgi:hypothetical protein